MKIKFLIRLSLTLTILFILFNFKTASAQSNNSDFSVSIVPEEHQIDKKATFFDLKVKPKEKVHLSSFIENHEKEEKEFEIIPVNATTSDNGEIDYGSIKDKKEIDSSLKYPFTSLVNKKQKVKIKSGDSKVVKFDLNIPEEEFDGIILGSFIVRIVDEKDKNKKNDAISLKNMFEIRKAVSIKMNDKLVIPNLVINDTTTNLVNNVPAVTANIQNTQSISFNEISISAVVTDKKSNKVIRKQKTDSLSMAPNSNFNYAIFWNDTPLVEGSYLLKLSITSGSEKWDLSKDFSISKSESTKFLDFYDEAPKKKNVWLTVLIISLTLLILVIIVFSAIYIYKKTNKNTQKKNKKKTR